MCKLRLKSINKYKKISLELEDNADFFWLKQKVLTSPGIPDMLITWKNERKEKKKSWENLSPLFFSYPMNENSALEGLHTGSQSVWIDRLN